MMMYKKYISIKEFSEFKSIPEDKVFELMQDGVYEGKFEGEEWFISLNETEKPTEEVGFIWWQVWAWLGLTLGNVYTWYALQNEIGIFIIVVNSFLMIMILQYNKYAFLIATVLSLNPIAWVINGIYLKNRWSHDKVNKKTKFT